MRTALLIAAALLLSGCRAGRPDRRQQRHDLQVADSQFPDKINGSFKPEANNSKLKANSPLQPPAPDAPASQHREYRKNLKKQSKADARVARAQPRTVPLIQGRAAVNAPLATQVQASYKPRGPVVQADSGSAVQVAVAAKNAQAAAGQGNVQQRTEPARTPWWRTLLNWWPAVALAGLLWFFWPPILALLRRRG